MDNNKRRIASLALFRTLYNEGHNDIMAILCEFVKNIVFGKQLTAFTPTQIKIELKIEYDFSVPEYVVESVVKKFCRKENSLYYPKEDVVPQKINDQEIEKIERSHDLIITKLISYVEDKLSKQLSDNEKDKLVQSFCSFLIDDSNVEYADYISSFVIQTQKDESLSFLLRTIKEGVVLYTGIQYNDNVSEIGSWKDDFTIFVEQEILFHLAGYNGILYKQLFMDFFELIKEVNRKALKQLIRIKYFDSVKNEIDKFFNIAERIVDGKDTLDCSNIAMTAIVQGCEHRSDVIAKKMEFYKLLKDNSITEEESNKYIRERQKYNIFFEDNLKCLSADLPERNIEWSLNLLNNISLIRNGNTSGFENSKCILLTGNSTTMAVALHPLIKQNGMVPFATTLDYITNKVWFKLNKGFGCNNYPKSFEIVTKAQIVLSTLIVGSVSQEFERIKKEISEKDKSESVIAAELAELKERVRKPEDIDANRIDEILDTISLADSERYLRERELERKEARKQKEENERLITELSLIKKEKEENEANAADTIAEKEIEANQLKIQLQKQINNQIKAIENRKEKADEKIERRIRLMKWIPISSIFLFVVFIGYLTFLYGWDKMEPITWVLSILIASIPYFVFACGGKSSNPQKFITVIYRRKYTEDMYEKYDVNMTKLAELRDSRNNI